MLTQARLKELLHYDPETGDFTNLKSGKGRKPVGAVVGCAHKHGYVSSMIDGKNYLHHRLAWLYVHGRFPAADTDHADGDRTNNRLANLREATRAENCQNAALKANNRCGTTGIHQVGHRWRANITVRGQRTNLGYFATMQEAQSAYLAAKSDLHKFQPVPREAMT